MQTAAQGPRLPVRWCVATGSCQPHAAVTPESLSVCLLAQVPDLIHLCVRHGDAAIRPVESLRNEREPAKPVSLSVNHDRPAWDDSSIGSSTPVGLVGIRDMDRLVEGAIALLVVEHIGALRRSLVTLMLFVALRISAEAHRIASKQIKCFVGLVDQHSVRHFCSRREAASESDDVYKQASEHQSHS